MLNHQKSALQQHYIFLFFNNWAIIYMKSFENNDNRELKAIKRIHPNFRTPAKAFFEIVCNLFDSVYKQRL